MDVENHGDSTDEQMGSKKKFWFSSDESRWLFKYVRLNDCGELGEDWAECLVHVVARLLDLPSACVCLAKEGGRRGVAIKRVHGAEEQLVHGNELLAEGVEGYDKAEARNQLYTVENIHRSLQGFPAPEPYSCWSAFDLFAGYLMMDALVAACDRHHENWGLIQDGSGRRWLAPTFDHGNALGFAVRMEDVTRLLKDEAELVKWVRKGRNRYFRARPVEVAAEAFRLIAQKPREYLEGRLHDLDTGDVAVATRGMPEEVLSEERARLAIKIIETNRRRLSDAFSDG
ncbi:hypothetical protein EII34_09155 [Arachnia propionica]|uniref:HipA-like C-terminal domain-containing protein n=1 Tax=Arachnia propionica TaxID=1750 RepID=A0A3P1T5E9_9ACTN|nr:hypothetical protein [Arachnia propionica]RRD04701.1 hypothetical protein EII34_09155 [Arachnia propionica]